MLRNNSSYELENSKMRRLLAMMLIMSVGGFDLFASPAKRCLGASLDRRQSILSLVGMISVPTAVVKAQDAPQKLEFRANGSTGVMVADIRIGGGVAVVQPDSKINIHVTGRLLGKNGWIFENSQQDGEPFRLQLGANSVVPGLESGLLGMTEGGKRRIVVPSEQGYLNRRLEPIPRDFGNRQRLYTTVMNSVRVNRERSQLGTDLAGRIIFDVELLRIR